MRVTLSETHKREIRAQIPRLEVNLLLAQYVAGKHDLDVNNPAVSYAVKLEQVNELTPAYPEGKSAEVVLTLDLTPMVPT